MSNSIAFRIAKIINERKSPYNLARPVKRITFKNGLSFSLQANSYSYCEPRQDKSLYYTRVEIGFPSAVIEKLLPYAETKETPLDTVYGYVPVGLVNEIILDNSGYNEIVPFLAD